MKQDSVDAARATDAAEQRAINKRRGFGRMEAAKQRELAARGGRRAHALGRAHEFTREEAQRAGRKGGVSVSQDRERMAAIGRKGGMERARRARLRAAGFAEVPQETRL